MARIGQNPTKWLSKVYQPKLVTLCTAVHIPALEGYWAHALEILDQCLVSMVSTAGPDAELMVLDNGSCPEVCAYLHQKKDEGLITYLLLSNRNLGKVGAWNVLFLGAPGQFLAYADCDVLFFDGWLEKSLAILRAFPKAGMVTAQPIAGYDASQHWTAQAAKADTAVTTEEGILIPESFLRAHLAGLQAGPDAYAERQLFRKDVLLKSNGVAAYAVASHFQFVTTKEVVKQLFPAKTNIPLGDDLQFDIEMKEFGYWRLATTEYLVHHLGNRPSDLQNEVPWLAAGGNSSPPKRAQAQAPTVKNRFLRAGLKWLNSWSYRHLHGL